MKTDIWQRIGGTKFAVTVITLVILAVLVWFGRADAELLSVTAGVYCGANVASYFSGRRTSPTPPAAPQEPAP